MLRLPADQAYDLCSLLDRHRLVAANADLFVQMEAGFEQLQLEGEIVLDEELNLVGGDGRLAPLRQELTGLARAWGLRYEPVALAPSVRRRLSTLAV